MKVLFLDILCNIGHEDINQRMLNTFDKLEGVEFVDVLLKENYINIQGEKIRNINYIPKQLFSSAITGIEVRRMNIKRIRWIKQNIPLDNYDIIFIHSYEIISFALSWPKNLKPRVLLFNHHNIDEMMGNKLKKIIFKHIGKHVEYLVYENYIKQELIKIGIRSKVWVLRHHLDFQKRRLSESINVENMYRGRFVLFAPSGSNDDNLVEILVNNKKLQRLQNKLKIYIKSKKINYSDDILEISNRRISDEEYAALFKRADMIFMPFHNEFKNRISGVLFDSFTFSKPVVAISNYSLHYFFEKYKGVGTEFTNIDEFIEIIQNRVNSQNKQNSKGFDQILHDYSDENIQNQLAAILKG